MNGKVFNIFLGYADDAREQIEKIKEELKHKVDDYLQNELPSIQNSFSHCKLFDWNDDASCSIGGQKDKIDDYIKEANMCIFTFFKGIGETTEKEVVLAKNNSKYTTCLFPDKGTLNDLLSEVNDDEEFEVRSKIHSFKKSLTEDWNSNDSKSITPASDYNDESIIDISFEKVKSVIREYLKENETKDIESEVLFPKVVEVKEKLPSVCIYMASPLNSDIDYDLKNILFTFKKYEIELTVKTLNEDNLLDSYDYDYCFVFTKTNNEKIIIEDDFFLQKSISIEELNGCMTSDNTLLFLDKEIENTFFLIKKVDSNSKIKQVLASTLNKDYSFKKNKYDLKDYITELPNEIDEKNLIHFVGRDTDIENTVKKILTVKNENMILTIKGSGGIGKTTLVSKIAVEFSKRNMFSDGMKFIQCEFIKDYEDFENKLSFAFDMNNAINFKEQLKEHINSDENRLIILDNIETVLHIQESQKIKEFISFVSDYATIVITSREKINEEYEEVYNLRDFTTDEAEELFLKKYPLKKYDRKFLRIDILEEMLNNNPLAIKIVANNLPKGKNLLNLKEDLKDSFFSITDSEVENMFEKEVDLNIKRTKSLFQSINYSYSKLSKKEKLALELLSLFPDGMHLEDFKKFYNQKVDSKIKDKNEKVKKLKEISEIKKESFSDKDLKSLEDKSLVIINNQKICLQSITGRFANYKFENRNTKEKLEYYKKSYLYNSFIVGVLRNRSISEEFRSSVFEENKNNLLKSLDYISYLENDLKIINFIDDLCLSFRYTSPNKKIFEKLKNLLVCFKEDSVEREFINSLVMCLNYFYYSFEKTFSLICKDYPFEKIRDKIDNYKDIELLTITNIMTIYAFEGMQYEVLKLKISQEMGNYFFSLQIGDYNFYEQYRLRYYIDTQTDFEFQLNCEKIDVVKIKKYIATLNKNQIFQNVQALYILIKASKSEVTKKDIKKLIISNPFTEGLKLLMTAIKSDDSDAKIIYEQSIEKLFHIKYYYVEAILIYCKYLKNNSIDEYQKWFKKGKSLSKKYYYRYLLHEFICLDSNVEKIYKEEDYPLPEKLDYSNVYSKIEL